MIESELIKQISTGTQSPWFIFNAHDLEQKRRTEVEIWRWTYLPFEVSEEKEVQTEDPDCSRHRRKVLLRYNNEWREDRKMKYEHGRNHPSYITDRIEFPGVRIENTYTLSPNLQNLITQAVLQPRNPANLAELQTKIQSVHFVRGAGYNPSKPWLVFDKQWLYEQITNPNPDEDFFIIQGLPYGAKNDTELKQFLQQEGYLPADQSSNQGSENHSQSNNNSTSSNYTYSDSRNTVYSSPTSSSSSSNNYNSTTSANSDSESYSSDSCSSSSNYSSSPSTSTASETNENKSDSYANSPSSSADHSSSASSGGSYAGSFSNGGGGNNSSITPAEPKPQVGTTTSQPTFEPKKLASSSQPDKPPNSSLQQDPLTKQKQQIIQEIQTELKQLPNLNSTELANWKQEIEQMTSLEAVKAYQKNLLKKLEEKNQLRQEVEIDSAKGNKDNKSIGWMMGVGVLLLASGLTGYLFWKNKRANK